MREKASELKYTNKSDIYRSHSMTYVCETDWTVLCPQATNI